MRYLRSGSHRILLTWLLSIFLLTACFIMIINVLCHSIFETKFLKNQLRQKHCIHDTSLCPSNFPCVSTLACNITFYDNNNVDTTITNEVSLQICNNYYEANGTKCNDVCLVNSTGICEGDGICHGICKGICRTSTFNKSSIVPLNFIFDIQNLIDEEYLIYDIFCLRERIYHLLMINTTKISFINESIIGIDDPFITNNFPLPNFCTFQYLSQNPQYALEAATVNSLMILENLISTPQKPNINSWGYFDTKYTGMSLLDDQFTEKYCYRTENYCYISPVYIFYMDC